MLSPGAAPSWSVGAPKPGTESLSSGKDAKYKDKAWADRGYGQLDDNQRRMMDEVARDGDGAGAWNELSPAQRAGFLNITSVLKGNGFGLSGLSLQEGGIQQDRLLFTPASGARLEGPLRSAIGSREARGDRGFSNDKPEEHLHPGMADWGGRQWVTQNSMQIGGGPAGVFVDIDQYGPKVDVVGTVGHIFEVVRNSGKDKDGNKKKTDPFEVAKGLDKRGDDP